MDRHGSTQGPRRARIALALLLILSAGILACLDAGPAATAALAVAAGGFVPVACLMGSPASAEADGAVPPGTKAARTMKEQSVDEKHLDSKVTEEHAEAETQAAPSLSSMTLDTITKRLLAAEDAISELKAQVGDIRTREAACADPAGDQKQQKAQSLPEPPSELELFYASKLEEAGLFEKEPSLPQATAVLLHRSRLFYLRVPASRASYGTKLAIIRIEAALNALIFASAFHKGEEPLREREAYRTNQSVEHSITSQIPTIGDKLPTADEPFHDGEWAVRKGIATQVESFRLPYRLETNFRVNMHEGRVLFELEVTPAECFPKSAWVEGLGRIVPTTRLMREREASDYALRLGLLLAGCAFRCTPAVKDVWVSAMLTTGTKRACYYTVHFDRIGYAYLDLDEIRDPFAVYASFGAHMDEVNETLQPVPQVLSLSDERFCPPFRYDTVSLSSRRIYGYSAKALGTATVSGLAVEEADGRTRMAEEIGRHLGTTTEEAVHAILAATKGNRELDIQEAARRTMEQLIDGSLAADDALAIEDEFVWGEPLARAVSEADGLAKAHRTQDESDLLRDALARFEQDHLIADSTGHAYRFFRTYIDRVLYNKLEAQPHQEVILLPDCYYQVHSMLASLSLEQDKPEAAAQYAARMIAFAPEDPNAYMLYARSQTALQNPEGAKEALKLLLKRAYDPETLGGAFAALAQIFEQQDDDITAAACYRRSTRFVSSSYLMAIFALNQLLPKHPTEMAKLEDDEDVDYVLASHDIPLAPTEQIAEIFVNGMRGAFNAEVFPVAKEFIDVLGMLSGDDVVLDIGRSLEGEPDR